MYLNNTINCQIYTNIYTILYHYIYTIINTSYNYIYYNFCFSEEQNSNFFSIFYFIDLQFPVEVVREDTL